MLLILSRKDDEHVRFLLPFLRERGVEHRWVDSGDFPGRATVSAAYGADGTRPRRLLRFDGQALDLAEVRAVWYRYPSNPPPDERVQPDYRLAAARLSRAVLLGLADTLDARWLPGPPRAVAAAQSKMHQLTLAPALGFTVPRTLVTNDPHDALAFWEACEGRVVTKLITRVDATDAPQGWSGMATHVLRRRDLANFRGLRYAPMVLQEYVPKRLELRVTVVGDRVFPCQIDSQASRATRHDWRHYDSDRAAFARHALPAAVAACCAGVVQAYGLCYGAIDLVLTPSGEYVFLELNPMGEWAFVQLEAGLPIADAVVDLLAGPSRRASRPSGAAVAAGV